MAAVLASSLPERRRPIKRRRTATAVCAGEFDPRPPRDVLTSLLNGVGPYKVVEKGEEERKLLKLKKKERERERLRAKKLNLTHNGATGSTSAARSASSSSKPALPPLATTSRGTSSADGTAVNNSTLIFWRSHNNVAAPPRSVSYSPPPESSLPLTPGPSDISYESRTSSKRPHTPEDDLGFFDVDVVESAEEAVSKQRKKRAAARKGWKGWVEGSPPPSDKLINLDVAPVLQERRLRSGKNFDAISEGRDSWVSLGL